MIQQIILKPLEWFEENAYRDIDGEYWESGHICDLFYRFDGKNLCVDLDLIIRGRMNTMIYGISDYEWCTKRIVDNINNPEYFI